MSYILIQSKRPCHREWASVPCSLSIDLGTPCPRNVASAAISCFRADVLIATKLTLRRSPYLLVPGASFCSLCVQTPSATSQGCLKMLFRSGQVGAWVEVESVTWAICCKWDEELVWANANMIAMWSGVNLGGNTGHWSVASSIFTG